MEMAGVVTHTGANIIKVGGTAALHTVLLRLGQALRIVRLPAFDSDTLRQKLQTPHSSGPPSVEHGRGLTCCVPGGLPAARQRADWPGGQAARAGHRWHLVRAAGLLPRGLQGAAVGQQLKGCSAALKAALPTSIQCKLGHQGLEPAPQPSVPWLTWSLHQHSAPACIYLLLPQFKNATTGKVFKMSYPCAMLNVMVAEHNTNDQFAVGAAALSLPAHVALA